MNDTGEPDPPPRRRPGLANWIVAGLIAGFGVVAFAATVRSGRADSALLFVGLPVLLAVALAIVPARTSHGRVFVCTTIALLLAAVALHEGAICVILAAPLVYLVVHGVTLLAGLLRDERRRYALIVLPLVLAAAVEGSTGTLRVQPVQSVEVVRVVALPVDEVADRIATGPQPTPARPLALRALGVPVPVTVSGDGLAPGDRWRFGYHGSAHGPGGEIITEVVARAPGHAEFTIVSDTAITARWFAWQDAQISWRAVDADHTEVRVRATFTRGLDPSWYFGPLQDVLMRQGMAYLLDTLGVPETGHPA